MQPTSRAPKRSTTKTVCRLDKAAAPAAQDMASTEAARSSAPTEGNLGSVDFVWVETSSAPVEEAAAGVAAATPAVEPAIEADAGNPTVVGTEAAEDVVWVQCRTCTHFCRGVLCKACFQAARRDAIWNGRYIVGAQ